MSSTYVWLLENNRQVNFSWNRTFGDCCSDLYQKEICQCLPVASSKLNGPSASDSLTTICAFKKKENKLYQFLMPCDLLSLISLAKFPAIFPSWLSCLNGCRGSDITQWAQQFISQLSQCRLFKHCSPLRKPSTSWESEAKSHCSELYWLWWQAWNKNHVVPTPPRHTQTHTHRPPLSTPVPLFARCIVRYLIFGISSMGNISDGRWIATD